MQLCTHYSIYCLIYNVGAGKYDQYIINKNNNKQINESCNEDIKALNLLK